jgi:hypothetical protein
MSTAFLTGVLILVMLLTKVSDVFLGQLVVGAVGFILIVLSLPLRKSLALAIDYIWHTKSPDSDDGQ